MTLISPFQRRTPFLHRNWISGINAWQKPVMGNFASSPERNGSKAVDHDGAPPPKRRRISSPRSHDIDQLIHSPKASDSRSTLRIEVLKILHKDSKKIRPSHADQVPRDSVTAKANCRITISDVSQPRPRVLHCQSQLCEIITSNNPVGPYSISRINLPRPFFVPEECILVVRLDDGAFDFCDSYSLLVELENVSGDECPPLSLSGAGRDTSLAESLTTSSRHWVMSSAINKIFGRHRNQLTLTTCDGFSHQPPQSTDYIMDVDLRWTAGFKAWKRLEMGSMPCITAVHPDMAHLADRHANNTFEHAVNGVNGVKESLLVDEADDGFDGEHTPSRSLRAREKNKIYNLKVLSDQALGRENKKHRQNGSIAARTGRVTYVLPTDQPVSLDYHRCVTCGAYLQSILQLQAHLSIVHPDYRYELETTGHGPLFHVTRRNEPPLTPSKHFQLLRPVKPFNLETFVAGDHSWLESRLLYESQDDCLGSPKPKRALDSAGSCSPVPKTPTRLPRRADGSHASRLLIPETGQQLFHPISKARLRPGQDVPKTEIDLSWLLQKHRESIGDFSDVTPAEKEFIREWDEFILQQAVTSTAYFAKIWLQFIKEKASWLSAAEHRMHELGKHVSVLLARDVLNDEVMDEAFKYINEARAKLDLKVEDKQPAEKGLPGVDDASKRSPRALQIRKSASGCQICCLPVMGPELLLCSNRVRGNHHHHALSEPLCLLTLTTEMFTSVIPCGLHQANGHDVSQQAKLALQRMQ